MANYMQIYRDIAQRTGGDIYIGVVGPVRSGKSTFIKRFMENVVLPKMEEGARKERAKDEIPQSASGKAVMTTEPKFVPEEAVRIDLESGIGFRVKLIDCVGFTIPGAEGLTGEDGARMVNTPWSEEPLPFEEAAELGTRKVIRDHATVGVVVTTDGSIGELGRKAYQEAEEQVVAEMQKTEKPFVILLNSEHPTDPETLSLAEALTGKYGVPVLPENVFRMDGEAISDLMEQIVLEFPLQSAKVVLPAWILGLEEEHPLRESVLGAVTEQITRARKTGDVFKAVEDIRAGDAIRSVVLEESDLGSGSITFRAEIAEKTYYDVLSEKSETEIRSEEDLLKQLTALSGIRKRFEKIEAALKEADETGYGIVEPGIGDMKLEEPEIVKQPGGYGVKFKASAPSLHLIRTSVKAEVFPIVGSERQSEDIVKFLLKEYETCPAEIWNSNMFGKSLFELVKESINAKLGHMQSDTRAKFSETLEKVINEGSGGMICIIL